MKYIPNNYFTFLINVFKNSILKFFFVSIFLLIYIKINHDQLYLFYDANIFKNIYENYEISWKIFDTKYQFLQGLGSSEFIYNLNISIPFLSAYFLRVLLNFDLALSYYFLSYLFLFLSSYILFSSVSNEKKFLIFLIYFAFFFSSISLVNYNLRFSNIFSNVPHLIELNAYINICIFFLVKSFDFEKNTFNIKNFIFFCIIFFYVTSFATISLFFYSLIFVFLIFILFIISLNKKIINLKYFFILSLLLFIVSIPNIIICLANMLNSNAYFFYNEIFNYRDIKFISYFFHDNLINKLVYFLISVNLILNFKNNFRKNFVFDIVGCIFILQGIIFSGLYLFNPDLLKLSPIYIEYNFLTILAVQSYLIIEKLNYKKKYLILFLIILFVSIYSKIFLKFPDYLKIDNFKENELISLVSKKLKNEHFEGKFATYNNTISSDGFIKWSENVYKDIFSRYLNLRNDFRILTSYHYRIPSLNLYSTNITPITFNYLKLLSSEIIKNERSSTVFDIINLNILEMLGVRFIINNKVLDKENLNFVTKIENELEEIFLYEINNFLSFKNPTKIIYANSIKTTNKILLSKEFNPDNEIIIHDKKIDLTDKNFKKLEKFSFKINKNYLLTKGSAKNKTLVVLPYQFSYCFISKYKNLIFPVNGGLLGIMYDRNLDDEIYYKQSLVNNFTCTIKDFLFFKKINSNF